MTEGILASGATARVDPDEFANATDHLCAAWVWLTQLSHLQAQEVLRFSMDPGCFAAVEVLDAWRAVDAKLTEAMTHLDFGTELLRGQRDGVVVALEAAAKDREDHS
ncbi:hypothetical protein [Falsiroseomonas sp.]|uniref:hypothetical protein n=1 Tax=Falsiroseomonas sp. TaxID=2870721 RepID=UPI003F6EF41F